MPSPIRRSKVTRKAFWTTSIPINPGGVGLPQWKGLGPQSGAVWWLESLGFSNSNDGKNYASYVAGDFPEVMQVLIEPAGGPPGVTFAFASQVIKFGVATILWPKPLLIEYGDVLIIAALVRNDTAGLVTVAPQFALQYTEESLPTTTAPASP